MEMYRMIIDNLRKGLIDQLELTNLENTIEQSFDKIKFYENLVNERDEHIKHCDAGLSKRMQELKEMQSHIDCLKAELEEVQCNKVDLPIAPIDVASFLINRTVTYMNPIGMKNEYNAYEKSELKQIAEHLLVHVNGSDESE